MPDIINYKLIEFRKHSSVGNINCRYFVIWENFPKIMTNMFCNYNDILASYLKHLKNSLKKSLPHIDFRVP